MRLVLFICFCCSFILVKAQNLKNKKDAVNLLKVLQARWVAEDESNYFITFLSDGHFISVHENEMAEKEFYVLSSSCAIKDSCNKIYSLNPTFFLITYTEDKIIDLCTEILNISDDTLSMMSNTNGNIFVFKRVKKIKRHLKKRRN